MSNKICVIPARLGSKRVVKKNIREFYGKPMIWWTINAAIKSNIFSDIIVSSDDQDVLDLASSLNVTSFLRDDFFDDLSTSSEATIYTLDKAKIKVDQDDIIFQLLPTCPLRTCFDIIKCHDFFIKNKMLSGVSGYEMKFGNPQWLMKKNKFNKIDFAFVDKQELRSQDLEILYMLSGAIWISKYNILINNKSFKGKETGLITLDWISCLDIDTEEELKIMERLASLVY
jgi:CMP-N-acetylneuraminic acid synthetase